MTGFLNRFYQILAKHAAPHIAKQAAGTRSGPEDNLHQG
jgi:hypothetical protein